MKHTEQSSAGWLTPVPKMPLSKVVVNKIKEAMLRGELKPGDFIPSENELVSSLGVGKSSVREAVKMLEALGVVEICKGQGCRIKSAIDTDVMDPLIFQLILQSSGKQDKLLEFRLMFETSASILAIKNAEEEDILELKLLCHEMEQAFAAGDTSPEQDIQFHQAVYRCTHNPFVVHIGNTVVHLFRPSLEISCRDYPQDVLEDHRRILSAFIARDEAGVKQAITQSLERWNLLALNPNEGMGTEM